MENSAEVAKGRFAGLSGRGTLLLCGVLFLFLLLGMRLVQVQYLDHGKYTRSSNGYVNGDVEWTGRRASITDTQRRALAVSLEVKSCAIDPQVAKSSPYGLDGVMAELQKRLELTPAELDKAYKTAARDGCRFAWVRRKLSAEHGKRLEGAKLPGVFTQVEYVRDYPQGAVAAHVLGFTDIDGIGREGVEGVCDTILRGMGGSRQVSRDALGKKLADDENPLATDAPGMDIELTIDSYIQALAEKEIAAAVEEFKATSGCALVMDPWTGDILAMAGFPAFSPSEPADVPAKNRLNPVIGTAFEPGSIFKPFVVAGALDSGAVRPNQTFNCEGGAWRMPETSRVLHDVHGYGVMPVEMIVAKSSNIGTVKIALELGRARMYKYLKSFGFGDRFGLPLPGELSGTLRDYRNWDNYSIGSIPIGQEVTVTPLQAVTAFCALANGGTLLKPRLIKNIRDADGRITNNVPVTAMRRVVRQEVATMICAMLEKTVELGTGKKAILNEYRVGGKTGTAQLAVNAQEVAAGQKGYSATRCVSSFVGVAPIEAPRLVVLVSVREPKTAHYGGTVSAPAVRNILSGTLKYLRVEPSKEQGPEVAADKAEMAALEEAH